MVTRRLALIGSAVAMAIALAGTAYLRFANKPAAPSIVTAAVTRGDVVESVDATGTLQAVTTVQVGTQVSGTIKALHADFNSRVRKGQVIAELEPSLFEAQVAQARASLARLEADRARAAVELDDAERKLRRARELAARALIPAADLDAADMAAGEARAALTSAGAQVTQARASLNQSEVNLAHTIIAAPIDGVVISRNVDVGQTVAASMQAPTLFVLAQDLTAMRVNASVAESDIGRIRPGQRATFRVDAYPGETFAGTVSQVRLEPIVRQNVVSYVATIDVQNPEVKLKPGMTANVTVEIARAGGVLRVPNAALRVRPPADRVDASTPGVETGEEGEEPADGRPGDVWIAAANGRFQRIPVRVGITNGTQTAIVAGALTEGVRVVTGISAMPGASAAPSTSPLLPYGGRGRGAGTAQRPRGT